MSTDDTAAVPETLRGDLLRGIRAIAEFWGIPERQAYHLASTGRLPGCFQIGRIWCARKSTQIERLRRLEAGGD